MTVELPPLYDDLEFLSPLSEARTPTVSRSEPSSWWPTVWLPDLRPSRR